MSKNELGTHAPKNEVTVSIVEISRPPSPLAEPNWEQMITNVDPENDRSKSVQCVYHKDSKDVTDPLLGYQTV